MAKGCAAATKSGRGVREIDLETEMLENSEEIKLPKARVKRRLELTNELAVAIGETVRPTLKHFAHAATGSVDGTREILLQLVFLNNGREEIHEAFYRERTTKSL
jgi:hypothetical protein